MNSKTEMRRERSPLRRWRSFALPCAPALWISKFLSFFFFLSSHTKKIKNSKNLLSQKLFFFVSLRQQFTSVPFLSSGSLEEERHSRLFEGHLTLKDSSFHYIISSHFHCTSPRIFDFFFLFVLSRYAHRISSEEVVVIRWFWWCQTQNLFRISFLFLFRRPKVRGYG